MLIPHEELIEMQDSMGATPAQADAFIEAVAVMFDWAIERRYLQQNPARGIKPIYRKGDGAKPWKAADVRKFLKVHLPGSKAHVALSVLLWTGCRIEDLTVLGRENECRIEGIEALRWTPLKKGSTEVSIPLLPPLKKATRAMTVQGATYVLGRGGKPLPAETACRPCSRAGARMPDWLTSPLMVSAGDLQNCSLSWAAASMRSWPSWAIRKRKRVRFTPGA